MNKKTYALLGTALALTVCTLGTTTTAFAATKNEKDTLPPWYAERSIITPRDSLTSVGTYMTLDVSSSSDSCSADITNNDSDIERHVTVSVEGYNVKGIRVGGKGKDTSGSITTGMRTAMDLSPTGTVYKTTGKGAIYKGKTSSTGKLESMTKTVKTN